VLCIRADSAYLQCSCLPPEHQSAYRRYHSTETAMLEVLSDAYVTADAGHVTFLSLLDLSATFDTVDHCILIEGMRRTHGFSGCVLDWIQSYLLGICSLYSLMTHVWGHIIDVRGSTGVHPRASAFCDVHGRRHQAGREGRLQRPCIRWRPAGLWPHYTIRISWADGQDVTVRW